MRKFNNPPNFNGYLLAAHLFPLGTQRQPLPIKQFGIHVGSKHVPKTNWLILLSQFSKVFYYSSSYKPNPVVVLNGEIQREALTSQSLERIPPEIDQRGPRSTEPASSLIPLRSGLGTKILAGGKSTF